MNPTAMINPIRFSILVLGLLLISDRAFAADSSSPKVWIYTDMSDPTIPGTNHRGTVNDPDDVSAMAGYLLMANRFETLGIVVASTHRKEHAKSADQAAWANQVFGKAYRADLPQLKQGFQGFPDDIQFVQSCIKESAERFVEGKAYESLDKYNTVQLLLDTANKLPEGEVINVLCWGSLTEPAILVAHCLTKNQSALKKLRFIAHWTNSPLHQGSTEHPEEVANCREDAAACRYLKAAAGSGKIVYHECGAIGQAGIVSGSPKGKEYFDQFRTSQLGTLFVEGKFVFNSVDHSDSATYWVLLGEYGVSLKEIAPDGTNSAMIEKANESKFKASSKQIHDELLRRSKIAAMPIPKVPPRASQAIGQTNPSVDSAVNRDGDWIIKGEETVRGQKIRINGNIVIEKGATLTLEDCNVEIVGRSSREHLVDWKGGTLVTRNVTIGGTSVDGIFIHTVFHLYDGLWDATNTTVQYSYGVSFGSDKGGTLRGTRFKAGPRPDAVIASGKADITLIDSDFPIALGIYTHKGGKCSVDLPVKTPITRKYDSTNLTLGVEWKMDLQNTTVDHWFVFLRNIGMQNPPCEVTVGDSERLIVSLLGHNLVGDVRLSNSLETPIQMGSLTLKRGEKSPGVSMYALYFSGDKTDMTIRGQTHICELMHRGGKLTMLGTPGKNELSIGCTTLEMSNTAKMNLEHVHLGRPFTWQEDGSIGEANVIGESTLTGSNVSVRGVRFHTKDNGQVKMIGLMKNGKLETRIDGGSVTIEEKEPALK